jgi:hypothetical protein
VRARYEGVLDRIAVYALGGIATEADAEAIASAFAAAGDRA